MRFLSGDSVLMLHFLLTMAMIPFMLRFVDGRLVNSDDEQDGRPGQPRLRVSDITTLVSVALVFVRFVASVWTGMLAWRCAFFLLETEGLTLGQFNNIISWRVHWPRNLKRHLITTVLLLVTIPSSFVAPILAGAVDWRDYSEIVNTRQVEYRNIMADDYWYWFIQDLGTRKGLALRAAGFSTLAWAGTTDRIQKTCRHALPSGGEMPTGSIVENATIPCIEIHDINWDDPLDANVTAILGDEGLTITRLGDPPLRYYHQGNGALLEPTRNLNLGQYRVPTGPSLRPGNSFAIGANFPPPRLFTGRMKVAVLLIRQGDCVIRVPSMFGNSTYVQAFKTKGVSHGNCFRIGTVSFTAGVIRSPNATYVSPRVIESEVGTILPHEWVLPALSFLPDVMVRVSGANSTSVPPWDNIDGYTRGLIRQSYMGTWDAMNEDFSRDRVELKAHEKHRLLQAKVLLPRLTVWFTMQLLVTVSGMAMWFLQRGASHPVVVDAAAVSLMVDSRQVLENDTHNLTRMSYVTRKDCGDKLRLKAVGGPGSPRFELRIENRSRGMQEAQEPLVGKRQ